MLVLYVGDARRLPFSLQEANFLQATGLGDSLMT